MMLKTIYSIIFKKKLTSPRIPRGPIGPGAPRFPGAPIGPGGPPFPIQLNVFKCRALL